MTKKGEYDKIFGLPRIAFSDSRNDETRRGLPRLAFIDKGKARNDKGKVSVIASKNEH